MKASGLDRYRAVVVIVLLSVLAAAGSVLVGREMARLEAERLAAATAADAVEVVAKTIRARLAQAAVQTSAAGQDEEPATEKLTAGAPSSVTLARDWGRPVLDDSGGGSVVVAVYDTPAPPVTVQARRDHVVGYKQLPLDLAATMQRLTPDQGGIAVDGPRRRPLSIPAAGPGSAASYTVPFSADAASLWSLTVWTTPPRTPLGAWAVALALLVIGGAAAGRVAVHQRSTRQRQAEMNRVQESSRAVAALAVVAQQSLDLGEALPAVTMELSSALGLRGLTLTAPAAGGDRPVFSWGVPSEAGSSTARGLNAVPAGQTLSLRLSRGGRTVADLRVVAGRDLDEHDVSALAAAGELLTSALVNAEAYAQQRDLVHRMKAIDELKTVFIATASHELRTPLVGICGYAELLSTHWGQLSDKEARSYVDRIDRNAQGLSKMVEDLLDFSRLERGRGPFGDTRVFDLGEVVGQVMEQQPDLAPDHQVTYRSVSGLLVSGSHEAVERIVTNLVGNAAKYSPVGTEIRVLVRHADGRAELVVDDHGPGIPTAEREQIFSRFYRGRGDEVTRTRGTGLGLAIVTEFAASMSGRVRVTEAESGGARFAVDFPTTTPVPDATSATGLVLAHAPDDGVPHDRT